MIKYKGKDASCAFPFCFVKNCHCEERSDVAIRLPHALPPQKEI